MKVLVLSPPLAGAGGIQRYTLTMVRALEELQGEANVSCVALAAPPNRSMRLSARSKVIFAWQALRKAVRSEPDLIICTHLAVGPVGRILARLSRRPYWVVLHGIEAWRLLPYAKRAALQHADRVIVTSSFSREQLLKRHQINAERIASLPCALDENLLRRGTGVSPKAVSGTNGDGAKPHGRDGHATILTVARMAASERYKGHDVVLRALPSVIAKIPNLRYIISGDGDDRARLERLVQELGIADHVHFTGEISDSDLAALYRASDVFVLPARTVIDDHDPKGEGFGIVFLEAMAFGKPVIGPNYGAPADVIRDGKTGLLVNPEDPAAVADAIVNLLANSDRAHQMGQAGSEWVKENYSYACFRERLRPLLSAGVGG